MTGDWPAAVRNSRDLEFELFQSQFLFCCSSSSCYIFAPVHALCLKLPGTTGRIFTFLLCAPTNLKLPDTTWPPAYCLLSCLPASLFTFSTGGRGPICPDTYESWGQVDTRQKESKIGNSGDLVKGEVILSGFPSVRSVRRRPWWPDRGHLVAASDAPFLAQLLRLCKGYKWVRGGKREILAESKG